MRAFLSFPFAGAGDGVCVCDVASFIIISPVGPLSLSLCSCDASFDRPVQFSPWQTVTLAHSLSLIGFHWGVVVVVVILAPPPPLSPHWNRSSCGS